MSDSPTLSAIIRRLRASNGWTLKEMSARTGIPLSTLAKVERGDLTLTYDKLQQISDRLQIPMSELFVGPDREAAQITARRSIGTKEQALHINTPNYDYFYFCTELRKKRMVPILTEVRAKSLKEFGALHHHQGEELSYVVKGSVTVITEFYDSVTLGLGQSIYFDSTMGHAYLLAEGCDEAAILCVMSSASEDLMEALKIGINEETELAE